MKEADKEEIVRALAQLQPPKSRISALLLKVGLGLAALAIFTTAALLYSSLTLYAINSTARQIVNVDLPIVTSLINIRSSLLAQENYAGKYAIFKDSAFIRLFRQRNNDATASLALLEKSGSVRNIAALKGLYQQYQKGSESLFAGTAYNRETPRTSAQQLMTALDELYVERLNTLQTVVNRADEQQKASSRWAIAISCAGFLFGVFIAPAIIFRVIGALGKLQKETHRVALGDLGHYPEVPAIAEIRDLASDFGRMADKLRKMEEITEDALPPTALPGNVEIERVLNERLKAGIPFSFCHLELDNFQRFLACHGYAKAGRLIDETGVLIQHAVREFGGAGDFVGHAGGEKFVLVVAPERVAPVCDAVIEHFNANVVANDTTAEDAPITAVSISVLDCDTHAYPSAVEIARAAVDVRNSLKKAGGNSWERASQGEGGLS